MSLPFTAAESEFSDSSDSAFAAGFEGSASQTTASKESAARIFNTAIVTSRPLGQKDFSAEIGKILESPAFQCILGSVQSYAEQQGISELAAAEEVIRAFRRIDQFWTEYLLKEGIERLRHDA